jgi:hypothetical protein
MEDANLIPYLQVLCSNEFVEEKTLVDIFSNLCDDPLNITKVHSEYNSIISTMKKKKWIRNVESDIYYITPEGLKKALKLGILATSFHSSFSVKQDLPKPAKITISVEDSKFPEKYLEVLLSPISLSIDDKILIANMSCYGYVDIESEICNSCPLQEACYQTTFSSIISDLK